ncbi:MAG: FG-GAP repeat domain-containing protein [Acutalibacter sp.]
MKIRPIKRLASLALGAALCLAQAGCSFSGLDAPNLMSPPRASLDQQGIYELLQGDQQELTLVYPKRGDHRSAILMHDWSGDGVEDAVGFVALDRGVEVRFLEKGQDRWRAAASFGNTATQVDLVCFGDLNGDGADDVIIGWGSAAGTTGRTASVSAYLYQEGNVTEYSLGTYGELALTDFDENGVYEVFTVDMYIAAEEGGTGDLPATAHVYAWQEDTLREVHTASADNSVTSYVSIQFGKLGRDLYGVVVDGAKADGSMTTQVFTLQNGLLKNDPAGVNTQSYQNPFARPSSAIYTSQDINGDGLLELPVASLLPGLPEGVSLDSTSYQVEWVSFQPPGASKTALTALMNLGENYWFRLPQGLLGKLSASNNTSTRTVTYTEVVTAEDSSQLLGSPLFAIRVFTRSAWDSRGTTSGYELLAQQGDLVYGIQTFTQDAAYLRAVAQVKRYFTVIQE